MNDMNANPAMVGPASAQWVIDAPLGFFGRGKTSMGFAFKECFYAYIEALRAHGKTVTVYEDHAPVFAVVAPRQEVAA